jgi:hypothetical protein
MPLPLLFVLACRPLTATGRRAVALLAVPMPGYEGPDRPVVSPADHAAEEVAR